MALLLVPAFAQDSSGEKFTIDPVHSTALFRVKHQGAGAFYGRFNDVKGTIEVTKGGKSLNVDVTIAIASVDSGSEKLDGHLKSGDFFDAEKYPSMTFKSKKVKRVKKGEYDVTGDLTIRDVTKSITVRVKETGMADGRRGKKCGYEAEFTIKRSEYGIKYGVAQGALGDETKVIIAIEAGQRKQSGRGR